MEDSCNDTIVLSKVTKQVAPFLYIYAKYLHRQMPEIFFNPVVDEFLVRLHNAYQDNAAWYEEEMCDNGVGIETVGRILIMIRDDGLNPWMYPLLQEAVQAPYEANISDLLAELPSVWGNERSRLFLRAVAEIMDMLLYYRQKKDYSSRCSDHPLGEDGEKREKITA